MKENALIQYLREDGPVEAASPNVRRPQLPRNDVVEQCLGRRPGWSVCVCAMLSFGRKSQLYFA